MKKISNHGKHKLLLDSSVIFAAARSPSGGSFRIFREAHQNKLALKTVPYILEEVSVSLRKKYGMSEKFVQQLLKYGNADMRSDPRVTLVEKYLKLIVDPADAPILAAADSTKSDLLVTLDQKHFFTPTLRAASLPFKIVTPQEFIQWWRG